MQYVEQTSDSALLEPSATHMVVTVENSRHRSRHPRPDSAAP